MNILSHFRVYDTLDFTVYKDISVPYCGRILPLFRTTKRALVRIPMGENFFSRNFGQYMRSVQIQHLRGIWGATIGSESWLLRPALTAGEPDALKHMSSLYCQHDCTSLCLKTFVDVRPVAGR